MAKDRIPPAGNSRGAFPAAAAGGHPVIRDAISRTANQEFMAARAPGVFEVSDFTGEIAGVNVAETNLFANFRRTDQGFRSGIIRVSHLIVLVKCGDVPG